MRLDAVRNMLGQSVAIAQIAKATDLSRQTVYRIKDDPEGAETALASWQLWGRQSSRG
jgi:putative DNA-invertase from lambdoid prophage Rac